MMLEDNNVGMTDQTCVECSTPSVKWYKFCGVSQLNCQRKCRSDNPIQGGQ